MKSVSPSEPLETTKDDVSTAIQQPDTAVTQGKGQALEGHLFLQPPAVVEVENDKCTLPQDPEAAEVPNQAETDLSDTATLQVKKSEGHHIKSLISEEACNKESKQNIEEACMQEDQQDIKVVSGSHVEDVGRTQIFDQKAMTKKDTSPDFHGGEVLHDSALITSSNADIGKLGEACNKQESTDETSSMQIAITEQASREISLQGAENKQSKLPFISKTEEMDLDLISEAAKTANNERKEIQHDGTEDTPILMELGCQGSQYKMKATKDGEHAKKQHGIPLDSGPFVQTTGPEKYGKVEENANIKIEEKSQETIQSSDKMSDMASVGYEIENESKCKSSLLANPEDTSFQIEGIPETSKEVRQKEPKNFVTRNRDAIDNQHQIIENVATLSNTSIAGSTDDEKAEANIDVAFKKQVDTLQKEGEQQSLADSLLREYEDKEGSPVIEPEKHAEVNMETSNQEDSQWKTFASQSESETKTDHMTLEVASEENTTEDLSQCAEKIVTGDLRPNAHREEIKEKIDFADQMEAKKITSKKDFLIAYSDETAKIEIHGPVIQNTGGTDTKGTIDEVVPIMNNDNRCVEKGTDNLLCQEDENRQESFEKAVSQLNDSNNQEINQVNDGTSTADKDEQNEKETILEKHRITWELPKSSYDEAIMCCQEVETKAEETKNQMEELEASYTCQGIETQVLVEESSEQDMANTGEREENSEQDMANAGEKQTVESSKENVRDATMSEHEKHKVSKIADEDTDTGNQIIEQAGTEKEIHTTTGEQKKGGSCLNQDEENKTNKEASEEYESTEADIKNKKIKELADAELPSSATGEEEAGENIKEDERDAVSLRQEETRPEALKDEARPSTDCESQGRMETLIETMSKRSNEELDEKPFPASEESKIETAEDILPKAESRVTKVKKETSLEETEQEEEDKKEATKDGDEVKGEFSIPPDSGFQEEGSSELAGEDKCGKLEENINTIVEEKRQKTIQSSAKMTDVTSASYEIQNKSNFDHSHYGNTKDTSFQKEGILETVKEVCQKEPEDFVTESLDEIESQKVIIEKSTLDSSTTTIGSADDEKAEAKIDFAIIKQASIQKEGEGQSPTYSFARDDENYGGYPVIELEKHINVNEETSKHEQSSRNSFLSQSKSENDTHHENMEIASEKKEIDDSHQYTKTIATHEQRMNTLWEGMQERDVFADHMEEREILGEKEFSTAYSDESIETAGAEIQNKDANSCAAHQLAEETIKARGKIQSKVILDLEKPQEACTLSSEEELTVIQSKDDINQETQQTDEVFDAKNSTTVTTKGDDDRKGTVEEVFPNENNNIICTKAGADHIIICQQDEDSQGSFEKSVTELNDNDNHDIDQVSNDTCTADKGEKTVKQTAHEVETNAEQPKTQMEELEPGNAHQEIQTQASVEKNKVYEQDIANDGDQKTVASSINEEMGIKMPKQEKHELIHRTDEDTETGGHLIKQDYMAKDYLDASAGEQTKWDPCPSTKRENEPNKEANEQHESAEANINTENNTVRTGNFPPATGGKEDEEKLKGEERDTTRSKPEVLEKTSIEQNFEGTCSMEEMGPEAQKGDTEPFTDCISQASIESLREVTPKQSNEDLDEKSFAVHEVSEKEITEEIAPKAQSISLEATEQERKHGIQLENSDGPFEGNDQPTAELREPGSDDVYSIAKAANSTVAGVAEDKNSKEKEGTAIAETCETSSGDVYTKAKSAEASDITEISVAVKNDAEEARNNVEHDTQNETHEATPGSEKQTECSSSKTQPKEASKCVLEEASTLTIKEQTPGAVLVSEIMEEPPNEAEGACVELDCPLVTKVTEGTSVSLPDDANTESNQELGENRELHIPSTERVICELQHLELSRSQKVNETSELGETGQLEIEEKRSTHAQQVHDNSKNEKPVSESSTSAEANHINPGTQMAAMELENSSSSLTEGFELKNLVEDSETRYTCTAEDEEHKVSQIADEDTDTGNQITEQAGTAKEIHTTIGEQTKSGSCLNQNEENETNKEASEEYESTDADTKNKNIKGLVDAELPSSATGENIEEDERDAVSLRQEETRPEALKDEARPSTDCESRGRMETLIETMSKQSNEELDENPFPAFEESKTETAEDILPKAESKVTKVKKETSLEETEQEQKDKKEATKDGKETKGEFSMPLDSGFQEEGSSELAGADKCGKLEENINTIVVEKRQKPIQSSAKMTDVTYASYEIQNKSNFDHSHYGSMKDTSFQKEGILETVKEVCQKEPTDSVTESLDEIESQKVIIEKSTLDSSITTVGGADDEKAEAKIDVAFIKQASMQKEGEEQSPSNSFARDDENNGEHPVIELEEHIEVNEETSKHEQSSGNIFLSQSKSENDANHENMEIDSEKKEIDDSRQYTKTIATDEQRMNTLWEGMQERIVFADHMEEREILGEKEFSTAYSDESIETAGAEIQNKDANSCAAHQLAEETIKVGGKIQSKVILDLLKPQEACTLSSEEELTVIQSKDDINQETQQNDEVSDTKNSTTITTTGDDDRKGTAEEVFPNENNNIICTKAGADHIIICQQDEDSQGSFEKSVTELNDNNNHDINQDSNDTCTADKGEKTVKQTAHEVETNAEQPKTQMEELEPGNAHQEIQTQASVEKNKVYEQDIANDGDQKTVDSSINEEMAIKMPKQEKHELIHRTDEDTETGGHLINQDYMAKDYLDASAGEQTKRDPCPITKRENEPNKEAADQHDETLNETKNSTKKEIGHQNEKTEGRKETTKYVIYTEEAPEGYQINGEDESIKEQLNTQVSYCKELRPMSAAEESVNEINEADQVLNEDIESIYSDENTNMVKPKAAEDLKWEVEASSIIKTPEEEIHRGIFNVSAHCEDESIKEQLNIQASYCKEHPMSAAEESVNKINEADQVLNEDIESIYSDENTNIVKPQAAEDLKWELEASSVIKTLEEEINRGINVSAHSVCMVPHVLDEKIVEEYIQAADNCDEMAAPVMLVTEETTLEEVQKLNEFARNSDAASNNKNVAIETTDANSHEELESVKLEENAGILSQPRTVGFKIGGNHMVITDEVKVEKARIADAATESKEHNVESMHDTERSLTAKGIDSGTRVEDTKEAPTISESKSQVLVAVPPENVICHHNTLASKKRPLESSPVLLTTDNDYETASKTKKIKDEDSKKEAMVDEKLESLPAKDAKEEASFRKDKFNKIAKPELELSEELPKYSPNEIQKEESRAVEEADAALKTQEYLSEIKSVDSPSEKEKTMGLGNPPPCSSQEISEDGVANSNKKIDELYTRQSIAKETIHGNADEKCKDLNLEDQKIRKFIVSICEENTSSVLPKAEETEIRPGHDETSMTESTALENQSKKGPEANETEDNEIPSKMKDKIKVGENCLTLSSGDKTIKKSYQVDEPERVEIPAMKRSQTLETTEATHENLENTTAKSNTKKHIVYEGMAIDDAGQDTDGCINVTKSFAKGNEEDPQDSPIRPDPNVQGDEEIPGCTTSLAKADAEKNVQEAPIEFDPNIYADKEYQGDTELKASALYEEVKNPIALVKHEREETGDNDKTTTIVNDDNGQNTNFDAPPTKDTVAEEALLETVGKNEETMFKTAHRDLTHETDMQQSEIANQETNKRRFLIGGEEPTHVTHESAYDQIDARESLVVEEQSIYAEQPATLLSTETQDALADQDIVDKLGLESNLQTVKEIGRAEEEKGIIDTEEHRKAVVPAELSTMASEIERGKEDIRSTKSKNEDGDQNKKLDVVPHTKDSGQEVTQKDCIEDLTESHENNQWLQKKEETRITTLDEQILVEAQPKEVTEEKIASELKDHPPAQHDTKEKCFQDVTDDLKQEYAAVVGTEVGAEPCEEESMVDEQEEEIEQPTLVEQSSNLLPGYTKDRIFTVKKEEVQAQEAKDAEVEEAKTAENRDQKRDESKNAESSLNVDAPKTVENSKDTDATETPEVVADQDRQNTLDEIQKGFISGIQTTEKLSTEREEKGIIYKEEHSKDQEPAELSTRGKEQSIYAEQPATFSSTETREAIADQDIVDILGLKSNLQTLKEMGRAEEEEGIIDTEEHQKAVVPVELSTMASEIEHGKEDITSTKSENEDGDQNKKVDVAHTKDSSQEVAQEDCIEELTESHENSQWLQKKEETRITMLDEQILVEAQPKEGTEEKIASELKDHLPAQHDTTEKCFQDVVDDLKQEYAAVVGTEVGAEPCEEESMVDEQKGEIEQPTLVESSSNLLLGYTKDRIFAVKKEVQAEQAKDAEVEEAKTAENRDQKRDESKNAESSLNVDALKTVETSKDTDATETPEVVVDQDRQNTLDEMQKGFVSGVQTTEKLSTEREEKGIIYKEEHSKDQDPAELSTRGKEQSIYAEQPATILSTETREAIADQDILDKLGLKSNLQTVKEMGRAEEDEGIMDTEEHQKAVVPAELSTMVSEPERGKEDIQSTKSENEDGDQNKKLDVAHRKDSSHEVAQKDCIEGLTESHENNQWLQKKEETPITMLDEQILVEAQPKEGTEEKIASELKDHLPAQHDTTEKCFQDVADDLKQKYAAVVGTEVGAEPCEEESKVDEQKEEIEQPTLVESSSNLLLGYTKDRIFAVKKEEVQAEQAKDEVEEAKTAENRDQKRDEIKNAEPSLDALKTIETSKDTDATETPEVVADQDKRNPLDEIQKGFISGVQTTEKVSTEREEKDIIYNEEHSKDQEAAELSTRGTEITKSDAEIQTAVYEYNDAYQNNTLNVLGVGLHRKNPVQDISQKSCREGLTEVHKDTEYLQEPDETSITKSDEQIPVEEDPKASTEDMITTETTDHLPVQQNEAEKSFQAVVDDLKHGNATGLQTEVEAESSPDEKVAKDQKEINKPMSTELGEVSSSEPLKGSTKETQKVLETSTEEREFTLKKEELQAEEAYPAKFEVEKTDKDGVDEEERDQKTKAALPFDNPVTVEASKDIDAKAAHKKSHSILSGVGSKVKHSISKVKKVITGKSSHPKPPPSK